MSLQTIAVFHLVLTGIVERCEADGQVSLVGWNHDLLAMQDRDRLAFAGKVQRSEDDMSLILTLFQGGRIEGQPAEWGSYGDVIRGWIVGRASLGKGDVVIEVVWTEDGGLSCLQITFVDTRLTDHPQVAFVIFYHALHDTFIIVDILEVFRLQTVLQQFLVDDAFQNSA